MRLQIVQSDWYHRSYHDVLKEQLSNNPVPTTAPLPDNNLINGKMIFDCPPETLGNTCTPNAGISTFNFTSGKIHRLRLINSGAEALQRFTIDNHTMVVVAHGTPLVKLLEIYPKCNADDVGKIDFVPVKPYTTNVVTLGVGQRFDVLVKANGKPTDAVYMRSDISHKCTGASQEHALAAIFYEKANRKIAPTTIATPYDDSICGNVSRLMSQPYSNKFCK